MPGEYTFGVPGTDVGIKEIKKNDILIYPNPAQDRLSISTEQDIDSIVIYDLSGRVVMRQNLNNKNSNLNIKSLSSGTYLVQIFNKGKLLKSEKLIKNWKLKTETWKLTFLTLLTFLTYWILNFEFWIPTLNP